jgi:hypothetical protein
VSPRTTIAAVLIAGLTAGFTVSPIILVATLLMVVFLANGLFRQNDASLATTDWAAFAPDVARQLAATLEALPEGVARRALLETAVSARSLLASASNLLDATHERATRDHVERLVEASCASALELAQIDDALRTDSVKVDMQTREHLVSARERLQTRLANASSALRQLYVTGLTNASGASDRVAELTSELTADASARRAALTELSRLLDAATKR